MSRWSAVGLVTAALLGCGRGQLDAMEGKGSSASAQPLGGPAVRLLYTGAYNYGCSTCWMAYGFVEVDNLAYEKAVDVIARHPRGWSEVPATWRKNVLAGGRDIFQFELLGPSDHVFAIRYRSAGAEHWDNHGGQNYELKIGQSPISGFSLLDAPMGPGVDLAVSRAAVTTARVVEVDLMVRNLAFHKDVGVLLSTDGWATWSKVTASFGRGLGAGELWTLATALPAGVTRVDFAAFATMDNQTRWDNNYQANFTCTQRSGVTWGCEGATLR